MHHLLACLLLIDLACCLSTLLLLSFRSRFSASSLRIGSCLDLNLYLMIDPMSSDGPGRVSSADDGSSHSGDGCASFLSLSLSWIKSLLLFGGDAHTIFRYSPQGFCFI